MKYKVKKPIVLDVSRWQGPVDWTQVAPRPVLVICRATEGVDYTDPNFGANWNGLQALNIRRGAYHYFHPEMDAAQQFANYQKSVTQVGGFHPTDISPVLDVEGLDAATPDQRKGAATAIRTWLDQAQVFSGKTPMIYTSKYQWGFVTDPGSGKTPAWSGNYPLWVAWLPDKPDKNSVPAASAIPTGWKQWAIWQYGNDGQITGVNALVDLNILSDWFAKQLNQLPPPPGQQTVVGKVISPTGVNVRTDFNVNAKIIGGLAAGTTVKGASVKVVSPSEAWLELRVPMVGWCAIVYNGTVLISVNTG
jgi:lysozyme